MHCFVLFYDRLLLLNHDIIYHPKLNALLLTEMWVPLTFNILYNTEKQTNMIHKPQ